MRYSLHLWDYISPMKAKHVDAATEKPVVSAQVSHQRYGVQTCIDNDVSAVGGVGITVILLYCLINNSNGLI